MRSRACTRRTGKAASGLRGKGLGRFDPVAGRRKPSSFQDNAAAAAAAPSSRRDLRQQRVDAGEARLRALLDAVLHRRVPLLGRLEAHRLRELRLLPEILELERLQVVLERLHEPLRGLDLAELALDDAVRS